MEAVSTSTLTELFQRDPLKLSDQDIGVIVTGLRENRKFWNNEATKAKNAGKKVNPAAGLNIGDLDLGI